MEDWVGGDGEGEAAVFDNRADKRLVSVEECSAVAAWETASDVREKSRSVSDVCEGLGYFLFPGEGVGEDDA